MPRLKPTDRQAARREVLLALSVGTPLAVVARKVGVSPQAVEKWGEADPEFADELAAARALGWDSLAHECLEIADDGRNDWMQTYDEKTGDAVGWRLNGEAVQRSRLRIETRMRLLRWWDNGRYGEGAIAARKVELDARITTTERRVVDPRLLTDEQRDALRSLLAAAAQQGLLPAPDRGEPGDRGGELADPSWSDNAGLGGSIEGEAIELDRQPPDDEDDDLDLDAP